VTVLPTGGQSGAKKGEWTTYGADLGNTRYSPLDQVSGDNFNKLELAWRFKTESLGPRPEYQFESTPLMVNGVVYSTAGTRRAVWRSMQPPASCCGCTASAKASAPRRRRASSPAAGSPIGATAAKNG